MKQALRRILIWGVLGGLVLAGIVYAFLPQPVPVDFAVLARGALDVTIGDEGYTRVTDVYVVSAPLPGRVKRIERQVGDAVVAHVTVLAVVQETEPVFLDARAKRRAEAVVKAAEAALTLAQADVSRAEAELDFARAELDRARVLVDRKTVSQAAFDRAQLAFRTREAELATARAALDVRRFELETASAALIEPAGAAADEAQSEACCIEVRAPVSGRVLKLLHESEGVVEAGAPLIEIGDVRDLEIVVDLLSTDAVQIVEGAAVDIVRWGGDASLAGTVRRIEPYGFTKVSALGIEEQRVNVIIDFVGDAKAWAQLGHGYRVEARISVWRGEDVLKLPLSALLRESDRWAAFVAVDGRAQLRYVDIGHSNGLEAEVLDGLAAGDRVVLHPSDRIADGVAIAARP